MLCLDPICHHTTPLWEMHLLGSGQRAPVSPIALTRSTTIDEQISGIPISNISLTCLTNYEEGAKHLSAPSPARHPSQRPPPVMTIPTPRNQDRPPFMTFRQNYEFKFTSLSPMTQGFHYSPRPKSTPKSQRCCSPPAGYEQSIVQYSSPLPQCGFTSRITTSDH